MKFNQNIDKVLYVLGNIIKIVKQKKLVEDLETTLKLIKKNKLLDIMEENKIEE
jgi:hypothetical protein